MKTYHIHKHGRTQGPFTGQEIHRFLSIGRLRMLDCVSMDSTNWHPLYHFSELIPESMLPDFGRVVG